MCGFYNIIYLLVHYFYCLIHFYSFLLYIQLSYILKYFLYFGNTNLLILLNYYYCYCFWYHLIYYHQLYWCYKCYNYSAAGPPRINKSYRNSAAGPPRINKVYYHNSAAGPSRINKCIIKIQTTKTKIKINYKNLIKISKTNNFQHRMNNISFTMANIGSRNIVYYHFKSSNTQFFPFLKTSRI